MARPKGTVKYDRERIVQLHKTGVATAMIARRLGCSTRVVQRAIREHIDKEKGAA